MSLSDYTGNDIINLFNRDERFKELSTDEKLAVLNVAQSKLASKLKKMNKLDYYADTAGDAEKVLAPTGSALANIYSDYIQIYIASDGTITDNDTTAINFNIESSSKSGTDPITYEITLNGGTVKDITVVETSVQPIDWYKDTTANKITVVANSGHSAFSIFVKNYKET